MSVGNIKPSIQMTEQDACYRFHLFFSSDIMTKKNKLRLSLLQDFSISKACLPTSLKTENNDDLYSTDF